MVNTIISTLKDKVSKEKTNMDFSYLKKDTQNKPKLSKKDYKKIDDELKKYFYFNPKYCNVKELNDSIIVYNSLNEREKMRCVFLLRKGGYDVSTIETFLLKAKISNLNNINLVDVYQNEFLLMFKEFSSKYGYAEKLIEINEIIKLISSLPNTSDEYLEWLEELKSLINTIDANISKKEKQEYVLKRIKIYEQKEIWN